MIKQLNVVVALLAIGGVGAKSSGFKWKKQAEDVLVEDKAFWGRTLKDLKMSTETEEPKIDVRYTASFLSTMLIANTTHDIVTLSFRLILRARMVPALTVTPFVPLVSSAPTGTISRQSVLPI